MSRPKRESVTSVSEGSPVRAALLTSVSCARLSKSLLVPTPMQLRVVFLTLCVIACTILLADGSVRTPCPALLPRVARRLVLHNGELLVETTA